MNSKKPTVTLERYIKSVNHDIDESIKRILADYRDDVELSKELELSLPAYHYLLKDAADLIEFTVDDLQRPIDTSTFSKSRAEYILFGISAEILLTGIHLKLKPEDVAQRLEDDGKTPEFEDSKQVLIRDLSGRWDNERMGSIILVLDLIRVHRNNLAHLGFHHQARFAHVPVFLDILGWLISHYAEEPIGSLETIDIARDLLRDSHAGHIPDLGFEFESLE